MKLEWMGEYRDVVEAIIGVANIYNQIYNYKVFSDPSGKILLTANEVQIIEYIYENEERNDNMSEVARRLSISQSTFSKKVKQLVQKGLLERYCTVSNKKNIVIKISETGKQFYANYITGQQTDVWREMFARLDKLDKESIDTFVEALTILRKSMTHTSESKSIGPEDMLIRLD